MERELERQRKELHETQEKQSAEDREKDAIKRWENKRWEDERKAKELYENTKKKIEMEEVLEKEKKEKAYKDFEIERERKIAEEELKKKKQAEKDEEHLRESLRRLGFNELVIDDAVAKEKDKHGGYLVGPPAVGLPGLPMPVLPGMPLVPAPAPGSQKWDKIARKYISVKVLDKYGIKWIYAPENDKFLIVFGQDAIALQLLCEESARSRNGGKAIEEKKKKKHGDVLEIIRKRSRSRSKSRHRHHHSSDHIYNV